MVNPFPTGHPHIPHLIFHLKSRSLGLTWSPPNASSFAHRLCDVSAALTPLAALGRCQAIDLSFKLSDDSKVLFPVEFFRCSINTMNLHELTTFAAESTCDNLSYMKVT